MSSKPIFISQIVSSTQFDHNILKRCNGRKTTCYNQSSLLFKNRPKTWPKTIRTLKTDETRKTFWSSADFFLRWYSNAFLWIFFFRFQVKQIFVRNHNERFIFTIFVEQDLRGSNNKSNLSGAFGTHTSAIKLISEIFRKYN